jgi:hypothetical protein
VDKNVTNPFQQAAPPAPAQATIPDAAAQQFAPQQVPAQTFPGQVSPAEFAAYQAQQNGQAQMLPPQTPQQHSAFTQAAAPEIAQMPNPAQQAYAQHQAPPAQAAPQGLPGQPWSPQQHQRNVPQAYAPPVAPPVQQQPAQAPQGLPQAPFPGQQAQGFGGGFPGAPATQGGGFDPSMFGAPSAGGGNYPKVRDLNGRLCLFRVKNRNSAGKAYGDATKDVVNYIANVAVLDGGALYSSPSQDDPTGTPVLVSETVPYVIGDLTIGQVGLQNRLKQDFVRGRVVRMPKGKFEESLRGQFPGVEGWQALWQWLAQDRAREAQLVSGTYFWGIIEDSSPQADQLVSEFAQNPVSRELML